jgi:hypothetical protein
MTLPPATTPEIQAAVDLLTAHGYLVAKIPPCNRNGGHGRHPLITRTASCEGAGPIPHGWRSGRMGTFGWWNDCKCGHGFSDYAPDGELTNWQKHLAETGAAE